MAQRYGGRYSPQSGPDGQQEAIVDQRMVDAAGARANILFVPGLVLVITAFGDGPVKLATALAGAAILTLAAWLLREGLRAQAAFDARKVARRPALPRKMLASALTGIGVGLAAVTHDNGLLGSALYGVMALGLHVAAFGVDPLRDKLMEGIDTFQQDRVARVVQEAEGYLKTMMGQIDALGDRSLSARVAAFQTIARRMIRTVEEDPRDLTGARKFLVVYLMGARDATLKFADLTRRKPDPDARAQYEALLTDLEQNFAARTEKMLLDDRSDMDIEIKVLRDRLQQEGISLKS
jgi:hypothetical protein